MTAVAGGVEHDEDKDRWRWLCFCGEVGGWRATAKQSRVGLTLHQQFAHQGRVHPMLGYRKIKRVSLLTQKDDMIDGG